MANEVLVGLKIGAVVSGSLSAAFGSAKSTVQQLGRAMQGLSAKQRQIGDELSASIARGGVGIERLRRQYDAVGHTLDQLNTKQLRLTASMARGEVLKNKRGELRGQAMEVAGTGAALGAPIVQSMKTAINFQDLTRDIAITGGFNQAQEARLSTAMRGAALRWNQTQTDVAQGTAVMIAGGIGNLKELTAYAPVMAKTATATRASMDHLGAVAIALNDNLNIGAAGFERSMNMLAFAGKSGQFELADMAKWLPQLTPQFAALGITGERAVAEIGASLQIARRGAGSNDEAANNFKNFLSKITAPDTLKAFEKAGIDLKGSMKNLVKEGLSPAQAMLRILTQHLGSKAPAAATQYGKALDIKDEHERQIALARLDESYKLGELFADQQVLSFIRPALANQKDLGGIQQGSQDAADQGGLDDDWAKRMGSAKEQLKELRINLTDIGISVGNALLPAIVEVTDQSQVSVTATCQTVGEPGNGWSAGQISTIINSPSTELTASNTATTADGAEDESDDRYRERIILAPEAFSNAGSRAAYRYHALAVHQSIIDVAVHGPDEGQLDGHVALHPLTSHGLPTQELLRQIEHTISGEKLRPLCDTVSAVSPREVAYSIEAHITVYAYAERSNAMASVKAVAQAYATDRRAGLGRDLVPEQLMALLQVPGVYRADLKRPSAIRIMESHEWANCTSIELIDAGVADG
ncbi:phage tail tape measure protein [Pseudomonas sp. NPDC088429]|uniref:phage tail tape measure protein n=1 Tax=Pseudomonas sp. NPDC088429 TaxID=3364455 RepID=UPI0038039B8E